MFYQSNCCRIQTRLVEYNPCHQNKKLFEYGVLSISYYFGNHTMVWYVWSWYGGGGLVDFSLASKMRQRRTTKMKKE
jgi:hypothetical protein